MAIQAREFEVSNEALDDASELRRRMDDDGHLFFRRLIDPERISSLRLKVLKACQDGGWLKAGTPMAEAVAEKSRSCADPEPEFYLVFRNVYKLEAFHRLAHSPEILDLIGKLVGDTVLPHPTLIGRIVFPSESIAPTPAHQDFIHIQGTLQTYTCWIPLGDCPSEIGGLMILAGSHRAGMRDHHVARGAGFLAVRDQDLDGEWFSADYQVGDVLFFHSHTVHKALPNLTDRLRLSVDYRYQGASQPIGEPFLHPLVKGMDWAEIYADWESTDFQYYWKDLDLEIVERDPRYYDQRDQEALELARQGDEIARPVLTGLIEREADTDKREEYRQALHLLEAAIKERS